MKACYIGNKGLIGLNHILTYHLFECYENNKIVIKQFPLGSFKNTNSLQKIEKSKCPCV